MSNVISHTGKIDSITKGMVRVRIIQNSACSSCKVASQCTSAESKEKLVDVRCTDVSRYEIGQDVTVLAASSVGAKAVMIAFVIPVVLIMTVIVSVVGLGYSELYVALAGMSTLIPYYAILYIMRKKLEKVLTFYLKE